jgi:DNA-binding transcriptional ArsR family regulator
MKNNSYYIFFGNLANKVRMNIIEILRDSPKNVNEISSELKIEQSKISHALQSLKCCNIVISKQSGKNRIYSLNKKTIIPILKIIDKHAQTYCNGKCNCGVK